MGVDGNVHLNHFKTHPNIQRVYDVYDAGGKYHIVMEIYHGVPFFDYLQTFSNMDEKKLSKIIQTILETLCVIHKTMGTYHG